MAPNRMSEQEWQEYRNSPNQVLVVVTPTEYPGQGPADSEWILASTEAAWSPEWLTKEVESIPLGLSEETQGLPSSPYSLQARETRFNWGADAASFAVFLEIAQWAATSAAWDALKAVARKMSDRINADTEHQEDQELSDNEAEARARWLIHVRYEEDFGSLELISIEAFYPDSCTVVLRGNNGWTYECDLALTNGIVTLGRIKKSKTST